MKVSQGVLRDSLEWQLASADSEIETPQLVLMFGSPSMLLNPEVQSKLKSMFKSARVVGCSTAGEIAGTRVYDESVVVTAVEFKSTQVELAVLEINDLEESYSVGSRIASHLIGEDLKHVFVLADGLNVNGSELARGLTETLPAGVAVTGGLAADADRFTRTLILADDRLSSNLVVAVGLYGKGLQVGYGTLGGWDPFGPERVITASQGSTLYEMDGKPALELYKLYLADQAEGLPGTGLLFPLSIRSPLSDESIVRTILGIDEEAGSITFAGDVPSGSFARLMKANFDRLVDGATGAAKASTASLGDGAAELAVLISCVGRKMVLQQRIEEEVEGVRRVLGAGAVLSGFYSYGELSPLVEDATCKLHNQTMTITTFRED